MVKLLQSFLELILCVLKFFIPLYIVIGIYLLFCFIVFVIVFFKNKERYEFVKPTYRKQNIFFKLFMIPYMLGYTKAHTDPNTFVPHGVIMFEGKQGCGKSSAMMQYATDLKEQYPLCKIISNTDFSLADKELNDWHDLLDIRNGVHGLICIIDETQQWFNSKQSKDFPPEMLSYITQLRKERKVVLGTCQQFYMVSKDIRTQVSELRRCRCILGVFNIVIRTVPVVDSQGDIVKYVFKGFYTFVQTNKLRNSYDTYKTVSNLSKSGFKEKTEIVIKESSYDKKNL